MTLPKSPSLPVLLVDDESDAIRGGEFVLRSAGITNFLGCQDSRKVMGILAEQPVSVVLLDLNMPYVSGEELLEQISKRHPEILVIIITGANDVDTAVRCMQSGAFDYMVKPVEKSRMVSGVQRAIEMRQLREEYDAFKERVLQDQLENPEAFSAIVTQNPTMHSLFQYVETIAKTPQPVLITGETGVGKELFARAVHNLSERTGDFVDVNVAGLDDSVFSDTLFGHAKGAFTGADTVRKGLLDKADTGTILLDEIGDLSQPSQVKLLRLLQEKRYLPLGSDVPRRSTARVVATTNRDLREMREAGEFRADLYFRLRTHHVHIPPLRNRLDDLPVLVEHFLQKAADALGKKKPTPPEALFTLLATYDYPGNIRELEGMVFDAVSKHKARMLSTEAFERHIRDHAAGAQPREPVANSAVAAEVRGQMPTLREAADRLIKEAMERAGGNKSVAAKLLGISRPTLIKRLKQFED